MSDEICKACSDQVRCPDGLLRPTGYLGPESDVDFLVDFETGASALGQAGLVTSDVAFKLPDRVLQETPEVPWDDVRGMRIVVDHVYHAVDYNIVWETLRDDVPKRGMAIED